MYCEYTKDPIMKNIEKLNSVIKYTIFLYILTFCMGITTMLGYNKGSNLNILSTIQMFYPALIVIILFKKVEFPMLTKLYIAETLFGIVFGIISIFIDDVLGLFTLVNSIIHIVYFIIILKLIIQGRIGKIKIKNIFYWPIVYIIFWIIYFGGCAYLEGNFQLFSQKITDIYLWKNLIISLPMFFINFLPFLGEEYGWRYFLQPKLENIYGKFSGRVMLGIIWGLWHIPLNLFFYDSPINCLHSIISQTLGCVILAFIFGFIYDKSKSIILIVVIHFLHNLMSKTFELDTVFQQTSYTITFFYLCLLFIICFAAILIMKWRGNEKNNSN